MVYSTGALIVTRVHPLHRRRVPILLWTMKRLILYLIIFAVLVIFIAYFTYCILLSLFPNHNIICTLYRAAKRMLRQLFPKGKGLPFLRYVSFFYNLHSNMDSRFSVLHAFYLYNLKSTGTYLLCDHNLFFCAANTSGESHPSAHSTEGN